MTTWGESCGRHFPAKCPATCGMCGDRLSQRQIDLTRDLSDQTPRYAPSHVMIATVMRTLPVTRYIIYPWDQRPAGQPIKPDYDVLECQTTAGSRYFGILRGYINSELRCVVVGTNPRDEVRMGWAIAREE